MNYQRAKIGAGGLGGIRKTKSDIVFDVIIYALVR